MLTEIGQNTKFLQESTEDALNCSNENVRKWFLVQEHVGGGTFEMPTLDVSTKDA